MLAIDAFIVRVIYLNQYRLADLSTVVDVGPMNSQIVKKQNLTSLSGDSSSLVDWVVVWVKVTAPLVENGKMS